MAVGIGEENRYYHVRRWGYDTIGGGLDRQARCRRKLVASVAVGVRIEMWRRRYTCGSALPERAGRSPVIDARALISPGCVKEGYFHRILAGYGLDRDTCHWDRNAWIGGPSLNLVGALLTDG